MDEMQDWEISLLADNLNYALKDEWEMTRWIVYSVLRPYLKKGQAEKSMSKLFPLPFDKDDYNQEQPNIEISDKEVEIMTVRTNKMAERFRKIKKPQGNK